MIYKQIICLIAYFIFSSTLLLANEKVTLQLKWFHQFQFAGYYAALEKGFYDEVGLDVEIKQRDVNFNNIQQVIDGEANYGVADSILLLYKLRKEPVVIVSPIFQHSPSILMSLKSSGIDSPYTLNDKNMLFYKNDTDGFSLLAMLKKLNIKPNLLRNIVKNNYLKLIDKEVDLMPAYLGNEPFYFQKKNIDINIINPINYGFDLYGDILFTNTSEVINHPQRVEKFKKASLKGWEYALNNKEEIIELIHTKYNKNKSIEHLRYEANVIEKMVSKDTIPIGTFDKGRIRFLHDLYKEYGITNVTTNIEGFIFDEYKNNIPKINLTKDEKEYLKKKSIIKVQNMTTFPPYNFNDNGKPMGYTIDYMNLMGKYIGINIEYVSGKTWSESLDMLEKGEIDVIPNIAVNEERKKSITFTDYTHLNYIPSLAVLKGSNISSIKDLKNKKIAVLNKSFLHTLLKNKYPNQKLYLASTIKNAIESVAQGKADAVLDNLPTIQYYIEKNWLSNLTTVKLNDLDISENRDIKMGLTKNNLILKSILEKAHLAIPYTDILNLQQKWMNIKPNKKNIFNKIETDYLEKKKKIKLCIDPNWMPIEKIENDEHIGMTSEYIKLFQKNISVKIELVKTKNLVQTLDFLKNRKCDVASAIIETKDRKKDFNFTNTLIKMPIVIATKQNKPFIVDLSSLNDKKIGLAKGFAYKDFIKNRYPNIKIVEVSNVQDGLNRVDKNQLYGYVGVLPVIGYNIQESFNTGLKVAGKFEDYLKFSMAIRNDEPELREILNKLIKNITKDEHSNIYRKWVSVRYDEQIDYTTMFVVVIFFVIIILTITVKNRSIAYVNKKMEKYNELVDKYVITSSTNLDGEITSLSQAFSEISGYSKDELIGKKHSVLRHEDMKDSLFKGLWGTISKGKTWKGEIKNKTKDGGFYWVYAIISPIFDEKNEIVGYAAIRQDITDKKIIEEISITDGLTNIFNRRHFNTVFPKFINRAKRHNELVSFLIMDVDCFKQYNDTYGHQKGDDVLKSIAEVLAENTNRADDYCFRLGGEEFGILYKSKSKEQSLNYAKSICKRIEDLHIEHKNNSASSYITVSIGLFCESSNNIGSIDYVYKKADELLYKAKESGRNRVV